VIHPLTPFAGGAAPVRTASSLSDAIGAGPAAGLTGASQTGSMYVNSMQERDMAFQMTFGGFGYAPPYKLRAEGDMLVIMTPDNKSLAL